METLVLAAYENGGQSDVVVTLPIVNTLTKTEIEAHTEDFVTGLLITHDTMDAYVLLKQLEIGVDNALAIVKPKAEAAFSQRFDAQGGRIGSAKVEFINAKPTTVYTLDEETQAKINENARIIAGLQADNEELRKQCIEAGKATKTERANSRGGLRISFDR